VFFVKMTGRREKIAIKGAGKGQKWEKMGNREKKTKKEEKNGKKGRKRE